MIEFDTSSIDKFAQHVDSWVEKVKEETAQVARGLAAEAFQLILQNSPQYSGDFVGNWQFSVNAINTTFTKLNLLDQDPIREPFGAGSKPGITYAQVMNKGRDEYIKLGDTMYISNSAVHDEPYALKIEEGTINFRHHAGNQGHVIERTLKNLAPRYMEINPIQVQRLRRKRL